MGRVVTHSITKLPAKGCAVSIHLKIIIDPTRGLNPVTAQSGGHPAAQVSGWLDKGRQVLGLLVEPVIGSMLVTPLFVVGSQTPDQIAGLFCI